MDEWTLKEASEHFLMYVQRTDGEDLLHPLNTTLTSNRDLQKIATSLHDNLQATALAASVPFYIAFAGVGVGLTSAARHVLKDKSRANVPLAVSLLNTVGSAVEQAFSALRMVNQAAQIQPALQSLLRQSTAMAWGAFETFSLDLFQFLVSRDLDVLREIVWVDNPKNKMFKELLKYIEKEQSRDSTLTLAETLAFYPGRLSMNLGSIRRCFCAVLKGDADVDLRLNASALDLLAARRNVLMHNAGIVDQEYVTNSREPVPLDSDLVVRAEDVRQSFLAISAASAALITAADRRL